MKYSNGEIMMILLIAGSIKTIFYKMSQYFPKPYRTFGGNLKVVLVLSSYTRTAELKIATAVDTSTLSATSDLAKLKMKLII